MDDERWRQAWDDWREEVGAKHPGPDAFALAFLDNLLRYRGRRWRLNAGRAPGEVHFVPPPKDATGRPATNHGNQDEPG